MKPTDLQSALDEARRKHAKHERELEQEYAVRAALAALAGEALAQYADPSIHVYPLYGRAGSITFSPDRYSYRNDGPRQPDRALFWLLSDVLPAQGLTKVKDGCLSFQPTAYVDSLSDEKVARADLTPVAPWLVTADPNHFADRVAVEWDATIAGALWRIKVEYPRHSCQIGDWDIAVKRTSSGAIDRVLRCDLRPLFDQAPEPPQRVKWGKGGEDSLNNFTLWWFDNEPQVLADIRKGIAAVLPESKP